MKILSIGQFSADGESNTCLHRNWALKKIAQVTEVDSTLIKHKLWYRIVNRLFVKYNIPIYFNNNKLNREICNTISTNTYDCIWIDKGVFISAKTLKYIKKKHPRTIIIGYSPDNMVERHNQSQHFLDCLPLYDYFVTTKSYTVNRLKEMGASNVIFVNNAYEETFHHPYKIDAKEKQRLGGIIGFIGSWEKERFESLKFLAENSIEVRIWGGGKWKEYVNKIPNLKIEGTGLYSKDYNKALSAFDISLCFLRKINSDKQTTRTMEIPACQSMLMAERTDEHMHLFEEGKEAEFFSSNEELLEKCKYYLNHLQECHKIALAGRARCIKSGYSNDGMIKYVLKEVGLL